MRAVTSHGVGMTLFTFTPLQSAKLRYSTGRTLTCSDPDPTSLEHRPDPTVFTSNTVGSGSDQSRNKVGKIPPSRRR